MSETSKPTDSRLAAARPRPRAGGLDPANAIALALSVLWLLAAAVVLLVLPSGPEAGFSGLTWIVALLAVVLPVVLIWVAALSARAARMMREESARLAAAVDAIRASAIAQTQSHATGSGLRAPVEARLDEIARAQRQAEATLNRLVQAQAQAQGQPADGAPAAGRAPTLAAARAAPQRGAAQPDAAQPDAAQPALALGTPEEPAEPIDNAEFIRALNFPEDERDAEGFRALRLALKDRLSAGLVRSAQDVLTLLAEDGIYMDDLAPDRARPEVWRRFAQGERGRGVAALGGVRDRSSLALTSGRMRQDPIFRDAVHHFLRKFDRAVAEFETRANDAEIAALAETRTARAFMLLGRVSGTFD